MKTVKVKQFREELGPVFKSGGYPNETLEQWQESNPKIKILDTKMQQKVYTNYENFLLVTYEEDAPTGGKE